MSHVVDDLELYAVKALAPERMAEIATHLRACPSCRVTADELTEIVASLADAVPPRDPPVELKQRILAAAAEDGRRGHAVAPPRIRLDLKVLAMAAAIVLLLAVAADQTLRSQALERENAEHERALALVAGGGRTWYMAGTGEWKGMGGNLMQPASGNPAFVVFHDLRPLAGGSVYTLWLISADGQWVRGTSFVPNGRDLQIVAVGQELAGYERCAVTVEREGAARREGPLVMQSRIVPPSQ